MLPLHWHQLYRNFIPVYHLCKYLLNLSLVSLYIFLLHPGLVLIYGGLALPRLWFTMVSNSFLIPQDIHFLRISVVMALQDAVKHYFFLELSIHSPNRSWRADQLQCLGFLCVCESCSEEVVMYSYPHSNCLLPHFFILLYINFADALPCAFSCVGTRPCHTLP